MQLPAFPLDSVYQRTKLFLNDRQDHLQKSVLFNCSYSNYNGWKEEEGEYIHVGVDYYNKLQIFWIYQSMQILVYNIKKYLKSWEKLLQMYIKVSLLTGKTVFTVNGRFLMCKMNILIYFVINMTFIHCEL